METDAPCPRAAASMEAFDAMPEAWRRFCAEYPRTAPGRQLAMVLRRAGSVPEAEELLRDLLPVGD